MSRIRLADSGDRAGGPRVDLGRRARRRRRHPAVQLSAAADALCAAQGILSERSSAERRRAGVEGGAAAALRATGPVAHSVRLPLLGALRNRSAKRRIFRGPLSARARSRHAAPRTDSSAADVRIRPGPPLRLARRCPSIVRRGIDYFMRTIAAATDCSARSWTRTERRSMSARCSTTRRLRCWVTRRGSRARRAGEFERARLELRGLIESRLGANGGAFCSETGSAGAANRIRTCTCSRRASMWAEVGHETAVGARGSKDLDRAWRSRDSSSRTRRALGEFFSAAWRAGARDGGPHHRTGAPIRMGLAAARCEPWARAGPSDERRFG